MDSKEYVYDLSFQQIQEIFQFRDITGVENLTRVRDILHRHDWQMDEAVYDQLNLNVGCPSAYSKKSDVPDLRVELDSDKLQVFNARNSGTNGYLSFVVNYILTFYNKIVSSVSLPWRSLWSKREPVSDVESFIDYFKLKYGDSHPTFYKGTYNQALNDAKRELLFLVVYLHKKNQSDCSRFCSLLTNDKIISFMNENNILFWACDLDTDEGNRVATIHQAHNVHPYVSVILLIDRVMTQVVQMKGFVPIPEFLNRLQTIIEVNQHNISQARFQRIEKYNTMSSGSKNFKCDNEREMSDEEDQERDDVLHNKLLEIKRMFEEQELKKKHKLEVQIQTQKLKLKQNTQELIKKQVPEEDIQNITFEEDMEPEEMNDEDRSLLVEILKKQSKE